MVQVFSLGRWCARDECGERYRWSMCLARGGVKGIVGDIIGFGRYPLWRIIGKVGYVCVLVAVGGWAAWARVWEGEVVLCLCVL